MSVRHSAEEYPEHLNPFHSRKSSFKESIRGLRKTLSFRGHDKSRPEIRKRQDTTVGVQQQQSRHTISVIPRTRPYESPVLFPRSRFSERVPKEKPSPSQSDETKEQNPFEETDLPPAETQAEPQANQPEGVTPTPAERKRMKRKMKKKRAPVPPNANGHSGSKWSLVSTDTEFSSACPSDYETDYAPHDLEPGKAEEILQITEEIQKLTEKTDGNPSYDVPTETDSALANRKTSTVVEDKEVPPALDNGEAPSKIVEDKDSALDNEEISSKITENEAVTRGINSAVDYEEISMKIVEDKEVTRGTNPALDNEETSSKIVEDKEVTRGSVPALDDQETSSKIVEDEEVAQVTNLALDEKKLSSKIVDDKEVPQDTSSSVSLSNGLVEASSGAFEENGETQNSTVTGASNDQILLRDDLAVKTIEDDSSTKTNERVIIDDHNNNTTAIEVLHNSRCDLQMIDDDDDEKAASFNFSESIVFAYAKDEKNEETFLYREKRSISLSGSTNDLQNSDDSIVGRRIEQFERTSSPAKDRSPKGRKSVPSKENMLLG